MIFISFLYSPSSCVRLLHRGCHIEIVGPFIYSIFTVEVYKIQARGQHMFFLYMHLNYKMLPPV